jgi:hypothetical protein
MTELARSLASGLSRDANQHVTRDFRAGEAPLPKGKQLGVRQTARGSIQRVMQHDVLFVDINENRVMTGCRVILETMIQDRTKARVAAEA